MATSKKMVCIYCGNFSFIRSQSGLKVVTCPHCNRETDLGTYQVMFDRWIDEIWKE